MDLLNVSGISKQGGEKQVLQDVSFTQQPFRKVAITGESGAGKSTLLKIVAGIGQADAGKVFFEGQQVKGVEEKLLPGHPGIAYLSQHADLRLNYRVEEILEYANTLREEEAATLYKVCRIDHLLKRRTDQVSGGEKQRIALARLLISSPRLLLLDEPFSNLDLIHKTTLKAVINDIGEKLKITCLLVSHDPMDTLSWADEIMVMKDGQLIQRGSPQEVYRQPASRYTAALFGSYNLLEPAVLEQQPAQPGGKRLFIRPEHFKITTEDSHTLKGEVRNVSFQGSIYELEVLLRGNVIAVKTTENSIQPGDTVYLSVSPADIWYL